MKTVFFDTNVMLDFLGERKLFYETASKLITLSERGSFRIVVSPVSFVNTNYILSKYENSIFDVFFLTNKSSRFMDSSYLFWTRTLFK